MSNKTDFSRVPFYSSEIITEDNIGLFLPGIPEENPIHEAAEDLAKHNGTVDFLEYDSKRHAVMKFLSNYFEYIPAIVFVVFALLFNVLTGIVMLAASLLIILVIVLGINFSIKKELRKAPDDKFGEVQKYVKEHFYTIGEYSEKTGKNLDGLSKNKKFRFRVFQDKKSCYCVILEEA